MKYYHKIETVYNRELTGTRNLLEGDFRDPVVRMLAPYPIWCAWEKLDGSNHAIEWDGHHINLHGRTNKSNIPKHILEYFDSKFSNNEVEEIFEQLFGEHEVILYCEAVGPKVQTYGKFYSDSVKFVLLDVYFVGSSSFADYEFIKNVAHAFNIDCKQLMMKGSLYEIIDFVKTNPLSICSEHSLIAEGVVCTPEVELCHSAGGGRVIVKIKGSDHSSNFLQMMKSYK